MACNPSQSNQQQVTTPTNNTRTGTKASSIYEVLPPQAFKAKLSEKKEPQLVDVRTPGEVAKGSITNAVNLNFYDADFQSKIAQLDKSKPLFLYCAVGGRSGQASKICKNLGFKEIYDLQGGYTAWQLLKNE